MKNLPTRPTTDFTKESLFNILINNYPFPPKRALDLFAGTGSISFELISRGCTSVHAVEKDKRCIHLIQTVTNQLNVNSELSCTSLNVFSFLKHHKQQYDFIFADPPYDLAALPQLPQLVLKPHLLESGGLFVLEHGADHDFSTWPYFDQMRSYGRTRLSFFEYSDEQER